LLTTYLRILDLFDTRERRQFWLLLCLAVVTGLFEMVGVVSILPFLKVISNPSVIETNVYLNAVYQWLGFPSTKYFLIFLGAVSFALLVVSQSVRAFSAYALLRFGRMRAFTISQRLLVAYLRQPYAWFLHRHTADLAKTILSEVDTVFTMVIAPALRLLPYGMTSVLLVAALLFANPWAAILGLRPDLFSHPAPADPHWQGGCPR
jgi:ABC-type multidrug transport system fused ATPase/permease subunit